MGNSEKCHRLADQAGVRKGLETPAETGCGQMPWRCTVERSLPSEGRALGSTFASAPVSCVTLDMPVTSLSSHFLIYTMNK